MAAKTSSTSVIVTCAVTGAIHTPTMSEHLPITPDQIAAEAIGAAHAGAAIVHLHARDPLDGRPSPAPALFAQFLPRIKDGCDAVINITTGGGQNMTVQQRLECALACQPEMCSLNMGSMNFGLYPTLNRYQTFKYEWEPAYLEGSRRGTGLGVENVRRRLGASFGDRASLSIEAGPESYRVSVTLPIEEAAAS